MRLVYFSPVPWHSFSQRPHEFVRYFHDCTGGDVLWIDPYPSRFPRASDLFSVKPVRVKVECPAWVSVVKSRALPIEPIPYSFFLNSLFLSGIYTAIDQFVDEESILAIGKPSLSALRELGRGKYLLSIYDAMDDFPIFYDGMSRWAMENRERQLLSKVSRVLVSSSRLYSKFSGRGADVRMVLNGCASDRLPVSVSNKTEKKGGVAVLGYIGTIGKWFDWELVRRLADALPGIVVRIVGPLYSPPPFDLPKNVRCESAVPHEEALKLITQFDVGLIPFKVNELTESVDPIKYYEYRALGLPVISTEFGEMARRGGHEGVFLVADHSDFSTIVSRALKQLSLSHNMSADEFQKRYSWEARFSGADVFGL